EGPPQLFFDTLEVGIGTAARRARCFRLRLAQAPDELLGLSHREVLTDHRVEHAVLELLRETAECPPVALRQATVGDGGLDAGSEIEQAERVGDRRPGTTDARGEVVLAESELVDQLAVGVRRLERIEILALQVLHQRDLELLAIGELTDHSGDPVETGSLSGPEPALTGDQLV